MKLNRFNNDREFFTRTREYLLEKEFINSLLLRLSARLKDNPQTYAEDPPYLATVEKDNNLLAVALREPQRNLILSDVKDLAALETIAADLYKNSSEIPGVIGLTKETETFAEIWHNLTGQSYKISEYQRIHKLEKVQPVNKAKGNLISANSSDRDLLLFWLQEFDREALGDNTRKIEKKAVARGINKNYFYFWQDNNNKPVSFASFSPVTPNCVNIAPVYTPPEYRRKGYATSLVADLSQMLLDRGFKYCLLFTDLANPTSNHIYRKIGYQPVCDWNEYSFFNRE